MVIRYVIVKQIVSYSVLGDWIEGNMLNPNEWGVPTAPREFSILYVLWET